jgi:hypothetical protein
LTVSAEVLERTAQEIQEAIGRRFGELEVVGRTTVASIRPNDRRARVNLRCSCGVERVARWAHVRDGQLTTCGTKAHRDAIQSRRAEAYIGTTHGTLTIERVLPVETGRGTQVWVRCDCGNDRGASLNDLLGGGVRTCGGDAHKQEAPIVARRWHVSGLSQTYAIEAVGAKVIKIGTARDLEKRLRKMQFVSPVELHAFAICDQNIERELHRALDVYRSHGEWFHKNDTVLALIAQRMKPMSLSMLKSTKVKPGRQGPTPCKFCGMPGHYAKTCRARFGVASPRND